MRKPRLKIVFIILFLLTGIVISIWQNIMQDAPITSDESGTGNTGDNAEQELTQDQIAQQVGELIDRHYTTQTEIRYGKDAEFYNFACSTVYKFINYINEGNYNEAYNMIDEGLKETKTYTIETLKTEFDFGDTEKGMEVLSFEVMGEIGVLDVAIFDFEIDSYVDIDQSTESTIEAQILVTRSGTIIPEKIIDTSTLKSAETWVSKNGGPTDIRIKGLDRLYTMYNIETSGIETINKDLKLAVGLLPTIAQDLNKHDQNIETYYKTNCDLLFDVYGLRTQEEFLDLSGKVRAVSTVENTEIDLDNARMIGNIIISNVIVDAGNKQAVFELRITKEEIQNDTKYYIFLN
jgi:hypothetical protein